MPFIESQGERSFILLDGQKFPLDFFKLHLRLVYEPTNENWTFSNLIVFRSISSQVTPAVQQINIDRSHAEGPLRTNMPCLIGNTTGAAN